MATSESDDVESKVIAAAAASDHHHHSSSHQSAAGDDSGSSGGEEEAELDAMFVDRYSLRNQNYRKVFDVLRMPPPTIYPWYGRPKRIFDAGKYSEVKRDFTHGNKRYAREGLETKHRIVYPGIGRGAAAAGNQGQQASTTPDSGGNCGKRFKKD